MTIVVRNQTFYLKRRVPKPFAVFEPRAEVWISLKTDCATEARAKADTSWRQMLASWEALLAGDSDDAAERYEAARDLAQQRGFRFLPVEKVAALPCRRSSPG